MEKLQNEVKAKMEHIAAINEKLEAEKHSKFNLEGQRYQVQANVRNFKRASEKNADLQHELEHGREYVDDMQK